MEFHQVEDNKWEAFSQIHTDNSPFVYTITNKGGKFHATAEEELSLEPKSFDLLGDATDYCERNEAAQLKTYDEPYNSIFEPEPESFSAVHVGETDLW